MMSDWFTTTPTAVLAAILTTIAMYAAVIVATRFAGLRSFSKMSSFDFAVTVAIGTLLANTALTRDPQLVLAIIVMTVIFLLKHLIAKVRLRSPRIADLLDNQPILLMEEGRILDGNLRSVQMTEAELRSKLRQANVLRISDVRAVVMETTGDIAILQGEGPVEPALLEGVRR